MIQTILAVLIGAVVGGVICFPLGIRYRKNVSEREISSAEEEGTRIVNEAIKSAESKKREALLEAKEEILKNRSEYEKEVKERRADLQRQENRLQQKEENLDRKIESVEKKEEALSQKHAAIDKEAEEIRAVKLSQIEMLERISGFTTEEAKQYLIDQVEAEVIHETALKIKEVESRMKEECEARAREVVAQAIQRCAADQVADMTVSVVPLPNDEMKGRIIGREGRNIRTIETYHQVRGRTGNLRVRHPGTASGAGEVAGPPALSDELRAERFAAFCGSESYCGHDGSRAGRGRAGGKTGGPAA